MTRDSSQQFDRPALPTAATASVQFQAPRQRSVQMRVVRLADATLPPGDWLVLHIEGGWISITLPLESTCERESKVIVSPFVTTIMLLYRIPHISPFKEFRLQLICTQYLYLLRRLGVSVLRDTTWIKRTHRLRLATPPPYQPGDLFTIYSLGF